MRGRKVSDDVSWQRFSGEQNSEGDSANLERLFMYNGVLWQNDHTDISVTYPLLIPGFQRWNRGRMCEGLDNVFLIV